MTTKEEIEIANLRREIKFLEQVLAAKKAQLRVRMEDAFKKENQNAYNAGLITRG